MKALTRFRRVSASSAFPALAGIALMLAAANGSMAGIIVTITATSDGEPSTGPYSDTLTVTEPTIPINQVRNLPESSSIEQGFVLIPGYFFVKPRDIKFDFTGGADGDLLSLKNIKGGAIVILTSDGDKSGSPEPPPPPFVTAEVMNAVPEPSTWVGSGIAALIGVGFLRRRAKVA